MWYGSFELLTEEIRIEIFGSPDCTVSLYNQLSNGDSRWLPWKLVWNLGHSSENLFDLYGDSSDKMFELLAVVVILSLISSVRGVTWLIRMWHDSLVTWLIHMWHDSYSYVIWFMHMWHGSSVCDVTHMRHDLFMCDMMHIHVWYGSCICDMAHSYMTWLICDMTYS